jgi:CheY-like chemotaxis protein
VPRILVADDNSNIQKMVALAFQERGIEVTSVGNGEAAVRRLPDLNPDLVLADVFMPVRNGYEVCEFVKKDQRFAHIPVILLVGAFDPLDEKEARRVGADGVLKKPFVPPDPLIAMVMSALEKNPKVAAEVAKSKKAASEPMSAQSAEIPLHVEPKPLPEFPEPSPDEEDAIYGFGNSARALEDADLAKGSAESKALDGEPEEDDFGHEVVKNKWRRAAIDFEIPGADASRPALTADEHLDTAMFPSEKDVPPRHVRMRDLEPDAEPVEQPAPASIATPSPVLLSAEVETASPVSAEPEISQTPLVAVEHSAVPAAEIPEQESEPAAPSPTVPDEAAKVSHWMDMMAPVPASSSGDWMSALRASAVSEPRPLTPVTPPFEAPVSAPVAMSGDLTSMPRIQNPEPVAESHAAAIESSNETESKPTVWDSRQTREVETHSEPPIQTEAPFFTDDLVAAEAPGFDHNLMVAAPDPPVPANLQDPELIGPAVVRVTPEPLLEEDEPASSNDYNSKPEETAPMHSLDYPVAPPTMQASAENEANFDEKPVTSESVLEETSAGSESFAPMPEPAQFTAPLALAGRDPVDWTERIPTVPPPNREALADIPFLTPPPAFQSQSENSVDTATVDAVVRKVLERLESQIHGILSQGALKPLVENLLEDELSKKEK